MWRKLKKKARLLADILEGKPVVVNTPISLNSEYITGITFYDSPMTITPIMSKKKLKRVKKEARKHRVQICTKPD